jgi:hypothetical protein
MANRQELLFFPSKSSPECAGPANTNLVYHGVWKYFGNIFNDIMIQIFHINNKIS